ncbi:HNH endonuclease [Streptomyces brevispora]|uniref:HNH endonuclease n=1 Tax=Streptomyces brevispora TaxID=887462 RepID=A0ABZ1G388_9ACTN|nr:HNH endonuclease [Streptomyces brevispora]WSC14348.1 HNH endonuclease [Streptomyces brevispora]
MPTRPPTRCAEPGCSTLVPKGRCEAHQRIPWAGRDDKAARYGISSGAWRSLKAKVTRRDNGCCYRCGIDQAEIRRDDPEAPDHVLDHITPIFEGGSATDMDNLGLLCEPCDTLKSKSEALRANQARKRAR